MPTTDRAGGPLETFSAATRARFGDEAASWVAAIPAMIADLASRWSLDLADASATEDRYTVEARRGEEPLELELTYPDGWWEETTRALEAWRGDGTQHLFEQDPRGARLLERHAVAPVELDEVAALRDVCSVARRLWIAAPDAVTAVTVASGDVDGAGRSDRLRAKM